MAQQEHQKYWFMVMGGSGLLGIGLIGSAATVGTSTGRLDATGPLAILAYIAFACVAVFFVCGIRQLRFPLAKPPPPPPPPQPQPQPPSAKYLPQSPTVKQVEEAIKNAVKSTKKQEANDN